MPATLIANRGDRSFRGRLHRALRSAALDKDERYIDIISRFNEDMKRDLYGKALANFNFRPTNELISSIYSNNRYPDCSSGLVDYAYGKTS